MSAAMALHGRVSYKDRLKLMRARTAAEWTAGALAWLMDAMLAPPAPVKWIDEAEASRPRYYGAFSC